MKRSVICFANNKGGVGKSFIAINYAIRSAVHHRKRVLLIDQDPQTDTSIYMIPMKLTRLDQGDDTQFESMPYPHPDHDPSDPENHEHNGVYSVADIYQIGYTIPYESNIAKEYNSVAANQSNPIVLDVIPGDSVRMEVQSLKDESKVLDGIIIQLNNFLDDDVIWENYDEVVIDTNPTRGPLMRAAIHAATDVIAPVRLAAPDMRRIPSLVTTIRQDNLLRGPEREPGKITAIVPNLFKKTSGLMKENLMNLRDPNLENFMGDLITETPIRDLAIYLESMQNGGKPLYLQTGEAVTELNTVLDEIHDRVWSDK